MVGRDDILKPYFDIQLVRMLAASGAAKFLMRADGKANPANVGMDTATALGIIAKLSPLDFDMTVKEGDRPPADVYKVRHQILENRLSVVLYIKLSVRNDGRLLIVISFHQ